MVNLELPEFHFTLLRLLLSVNINFSKLGFSILQTNSWRCMSTLLINKKCNVIFMYKFLRHLDLIITWIWQHFWLNSITPCKLQTSITIITAHHSISVHTSDIILLTSIKLIVAWQPLVEWQPILLCKYEWFLSCLCYQDSSQPSQVAFCPSYM